MKVNDGFYSSSETQIKSIVSRFEEELDNFKTITDSITANSKFGLGVDSIIQKMGDDMYSTMSGKLLEFSEEMVSNCNEFVESINGDDNFN